MTEMSESVGPDTLSSRFVESGLAMPGTQESVGAVYHVRSTPLHQLVIAPDSVYDERVRWKTAPAVARATSRIEPSEVSLLPAT
jgi:hypothetical protein